MLPRCVFKGAEGVDLEEACQRAGRGRGGVDDRGTFADDGAHDRAQQRVVRATEEERVDVRPGCHREHERSVRWVGRALAGHGAAKQRCQRTPDDGFYLRPVEPAGLHQGHELRGRVLEDLDEGVFLVDGLEVGV